MTIEIRSRWDSNKVLFTAQVETVRGAVEAAVKARANLANANLAGAYLAGAYLAGAYLANANLAGADLAGADLANANLANANLAGADLANANLANANLAGAYLAGAYLAGAYLANANLAGADLANANLAGANLAGANLAGANLAGADLARAVGVGDWAKTIRDDIRAVLDAAPHEVPGLLAALWDGRVDGSTYSGACACLVGTIANIRGVAYDSIPELRPDSTRPAERWFLQIHKGDTPITNPNAAFAAVVIEQWQNERRERGGDL